MIIRWPGIIQPSSTTHNTVGLFDLFATFADMFNVTFDDDTAEDSVSFLPLLNGQPLLKNRGRQGLVHHSISGHFSYRQGDWKLLLAKSSGGWTAPTERNMPKNSPIAQLYNLAKDPGETNNLYQSEPEIAEKLLAQLKRDIARGRSTQGLPQQNDAAILLWK